MLLPGDPIPGGARVWVAPGQEPVPLGEVVAGRSALLCFYPFDWSPT